MGRHARISVIIAISPLIQGCGGHFVVKPIAPNAAVDGFRYYLPRPYLMVTSMGIAQDEAASGSAKPAEAKESTPSPKPKTLDDSKSAAPLATVVTVKLLWLPDTAHPYAVTTRGAGLGTFKGGLQLSNGWMLTNVSAESDAKIAETITAVSGLISSVLSPGAKTTKSLESPDQGKLRPFLYLFEIDTAGHNLTRVDTSALESVLATIAPASVPALEK